MHDYPSRTPTLPRPEPVGYDGDRPDTVGFVEHGITEIYLLRNPDKLGAVPPLASLPPD